MARMLNTFAEFDSLFLEDHKAVRGEVAVAEGYQNLATMLGLVLDMNLFSDPVAPRFIDTLTPFRPDRRWGGDNTNCSYGYAVVDPRRTYRVSGAARRQHDVFGHRLQRARNPAPGPTAPSACSYDTEMPLDGDGRFP